MMDPGIRNQLTLLFRAKDFERMWFLLNDQYKALGFTDPLTDVERISEYKWIVQQLRKYMFSKQDIILGCDSVDGMIEVVDNLIGSSAEYGDDRKKIVYNFMRDHWLFEVRNVLEELAYELRDDDEFEEDE